MPTFSDFRDGNGGEMCSRLGWYISGITTWEDFADYVVAIPDRTGMLERVKEAAGTMTATERVVAAAALAAAGFPREAIQLEGEDRFWLRMGNLDRGNALAVAATIMRLDGQT